MTAVARASHVRLERVRHRYANGLLALNGIDLDIGEGEFVAIVGPSGCGKSTLLRLLARLSKPSEGTILWQTATSRIGLVFQEPTLMPWCSAADNVALPLRLTGLPRQEARAKACALLGRVGLGDFTSSFPRALSGGMKMRTSLARALVTAPSLLLLDEPFAALDEITRNAINIDLLALWNAHANATVFVTHSVFEAVFLAQRIYVMTPRPGRIAAEIAIDAPYPRHQDFRLTPAFADYAGRVSAALAAAMEAPQ